LGALREIPMRCGQSKLRSFPQVFHWTYGPFTGMVAPFNLYARG
jgi:hypothetical protein